MLAKPARSISIHITLAALAAIVCGCNSNAAPDTTKVQVLDPNQSTAASSNLLQQYEKLNGVYDQDMADIKSKTEPEEKKIEDLLQSSKPNAKDLLAKDHDLFQKSVDGMKQALVDLSGSTSSDIDPMEHDKYIAYYTAIGEVFSSRQALYQDILDYAAKPDDQKRIAILDQARVVLGKEQVYAEKKR